MNNMIFEDFTCARHRLSLAAVFFVGLLSMPAQAQVPAISVTGLPAKPLIGEQFCVDVNFTNAAATTGYGPYLLSSTDKGITRVSIDFVDVPPHLEFVGTFDASGVLIDPISGTPISGNQSGFLNLARYPVGSSEQGHAALVMEVCAVVDTGTPVGVPLEVAITPGFEFGDTPTGVNGPVLGSAIASTVTPQLARIKKSNSAPEGERPPGPSHVFNYKWEVDISDGVTITDVFLRDNLPPDIQWTGGAISITAPLGVACAATTLPNTPTTPAGDVVVECDAVTGSTSTADLTVSIPVYIVDILAENIADSQPIQNTVDFEYNYQNIAYTDSSTSNLRAVHAAAQKSVTGTPLPGEVLTYTVDFQLTDYPTTGGGATDFILEDIIPDGMAFVGTLNLMVNGTPVAITPMVTPGAPAVGLTTVLWDVGAAMGAVLPVGSSGKLRYQVSIEQQYSDGTPVQGADKLTNNLTLEYRLTDGGFGANPSTAPIDISSNQPSKSISNPSPMPPTLAPGTEITFRLSLDIPSGSSSNVQFVDFLPRPVFDVATFDVASDWTLVSPAGAVPTVTKSTGENSVSFDFGNVTSTTGVTVAIDLRATITGTAFADDLFLTNLLSSSYQNSAGEFITGLKAAALTVGAPALVITKGVFSVDNPGAKIKPPPPADPTQALVEGDVTGVDGFDNIVFTITVENTGSQPAHQVTVKDTLPAGLSCLPPGNADVINGNGAQLSFTGDLNTGLILDDPLTANDDNPMGGGAPFGTDTALIALHCTLGVGVTPLETLVNKASVVWHSVGAGGSPFPAQVEEASITTAAPSMSKAIVAVAPGYAGTLDKLHIGEIATYQLDIVIPEGTSPDVKLEDILDVGLVHVEVVSITASPGVTSSIGSFDPGVKNNAGFLPQGGGPTAPDRKLVFGPANNQNGFGTVVNTNTNNGVDETISIVYRTRVLNSTGNIKGKKLRNRARWFWKPNGLSRQRVQARANRLVIIEPELNLTKVFQPNVGDDLSPPAVTMTLEYASASNADAFDLSFSDPLPDNMGIVGGVAGVSLNNCPATALLEVVRTSNNDVLNIEWAGFAPGLCTITFQTEFLSPVSAGVSLENCADVSWQSLAEGDQPLPSPPNNLIAVERTGDIADPGGAANVYARVACDVFKIFDVGIAKTVSATSQTQTDNIPGTPPGAESLTIGEVVTFKLAVTVPEAPVVELVVTDVLPKTAMVLQLVSARTLSVGSDLSPAIGNPVPQISDTSGDGLNDTVTLDYGAVGHILDGVTNDKDRIYIEIIAKVADVSANANNDVDHNAGLVRFLPSLSASDEYEIEVVEPLLRLEKSADRTQVEAGQDVLYSLKIAHRNASRVDAQQLTLVDVLPPELDLNPGSAVVGPVCTHPPTVGPDQSADTITVSWDNFPLGAICEIEFLTTVSIFATTGQEIVNSGSIFWSSLNTQGDPDDRAYIFDDVWKLVVSDPGLSKELVGKSLPESSPESDAITIGEKVTFLLQANFADGTSPAVTVDDLLPKKGVELKFTNTSILYIGSDLSLSTGLVIGEPASPCSPTRANCLQWVLGDVVNLPDNRPDLDLEDMVVFEVEAIVTNNKLNSGVPGEDKNLNNAAHLHSPGIQLLARDSFNLIEPMLNIRKQLLRGAKEATTTAGQIHRFFLFVEHQGTSTATAFSLNIVDQLAPEMQWVDNASVRSDCPGWQLDMAPAPGGSGTVEFSFDKLPLAKNRCIISYEVRMSLTLPVPGTYTNAVDMSWESAPGSAESRHYSDMSSVKLVSYIDAFVLKDVTATSVPETSSAVGDPALDDVAIGEIVEYQIVTKFTEGVTSNVILTDTFQDDPNGILELLGGSVISVGNNISTTKPGHPVINGNVITIDYGAVTNIADGIQDAEDTIVFRMELRVKEEPTKTNEEGDILLNDTELQYDNASGAPQFVNGDARIEVVEPKLALTKAFTSLKIDVATIQLDLVNNGKGPAYDVVFTDDFDESTWVPGSLQQISVPAGFKLTETSAGGITSVVLQVANPSIPPVPREILSPGKSLSVIFSMALQNNGQPGPTSIPNTANVEGSSLPGVDSNERVYTVDATDTLLLPAPKLEKTWAGPNKPAKPGDTLVYTLTLENTGDAPFTGVSITDTPDAVGDFQVGSVTPSVGGAVVMGNTPGDTMVTVSFATVAANSSATVSYDVVVPLPYVDGMTSPEKLLNQAEASFKELSSVQSDDPTTTAVGDPTVVPVVADPVMTITKDDQVNITNPGDTLVYAIDYGNVGDQDATGVVLSEIVPNNTRFSAVDSSPGWVCSAGGGAGDSCILDIGNMPGQSSQQVVFGVIVDAAIPSGILWITNDIGIQEDGNEFDPNAPVVPSTDTSSEKTPLFALPDLNVDKDDGGIFVVPAQDYGYRIHYSNNGNKESTGIVLTETVPEYTSFNPANSVPSGWNCAGGGMSGDTCTLAVGDLAAGFGGSVIFGLRVVFPAPPGAEITLNVVELLDDGNNSFGMPLSARGIDTTPLVAVPDLTITKKSDVGTVLVKDIITYTLDYANVGNQDATGAFVREVVPRGTVFSAPDSTPTVWSCADGAQAGTVCEYFIGLLPAGASGQLTFAVMAVEIPGGEQVVNIAITGNDGSNGIDPTPGNNIAKVVNGFPIPSIPVFNLAWLVMLALSLVWTAGNAQRKMRQR